MTTQCKMVHWYNDGAGTGYNKCTIKLCAAAAVSFVTKLAPKR